MARISRDLPGCIAAADTSEEAEDLIREAMAYHLEMMEESGEVIPEPRSRAVVVEVPCLTQAPASSR